MADIEETEIMDNEDKILHDVEVFESFEDDSIQCEEFSLSDLY